MPFTVMDSVSSMAERMSLSFAFSFSMSLAQGTLISELPFGVDVADDVPSAAASCRSRPRYTTCRMLSGVM